MALSVRPGAAQPERRDGYIADAAGSSRHHRGDGEERARRDRDGRPSRAAGGPARFRIHPVGAEERIRLGDRARLESLVTSLEAINPTPRPFERPELLLNEWRLVTTFQPGTADVSFFSAESWRKYLLERGPSPVQSLVVGNSTVDNVYQVLRDDPRGSPENGAKVGDDSRHLPVRALSAARFATCTRYPPISRPRD